MSNSAQQFSNTPASKKYIPASEKKHVPAPDHRVLSHHDADEEERHLLGKDWEILALDDPLDHDIADMVDLAERTLQDGMVKNGIEPQLGNSIMPVSEKICKKAISLVDGFFREIKPVFDQDIWADVQELQREMQANIKMIFGAYYTNASEILTAD